MHWTADNIRERIKQERRNGAAVVALAQRYRRHRSTIYRICISIKRATRKQLRVTTRAVQPFDCRDCGAKGVMAVESLTGKCVNCYVAKQVRQGRLATT